MRTSSLYRRHGYNDLVRNKTANVALLVILIISAFLMATGAMVMARSFGAVNALFDQALPPHFLQMHTGTYDAVALAEFASAHPEIDSWLIEDMLGYDGAAISWQRPTTGESGDLSASLIDNLFVTQNEAFDFLVDDSGTVVQPAPGEVHVPVAYMQDFALQPGDEVTIRTGSGSHGLTVAGFVRDSQMASSLSSATRFLVSEHDFRELAISGGGDPEIIVEYRLAEASSASQFQSAYESDGALPKNGQAVTLQMIRLINAFSDGLVAMALVLVSCLLMGIALLSLRFVIRGTLEDEVREIGVMKAIGLPHRAISGLYMSKYSAMTLVACLLGGVLAVIATRLLTRNVQVNYAEAPVGLTTFLVPGAALLLVFLLVIAMCRGVFRSIRRVEVVGALVQGSTLDERQTARRARRQAHRARRVNLGSTTGGDVNRRLALLDLRADAGQWALIPLVFALTAILLILPTNLLTTFSSPRFVTYMGAPESDLRVDLQFSAAVDSQHQRLLSDMRADGRIIDVKDFAKVLRQTRGEQGWETLRVEVGDYSGASIEFVDGGPPGTGQIALSAINAQQYRLSVGEMMPIRTSSGEATNDVVVSGIYQDVTSGGRTAKMQGNVSGGALGYVLYADVAEGIDPAAIAREYNDAHPDAAVIPMREYAKQTLSYVTGAFGSAAALACLFGVGVAVLITCLFLRLRLTREQTRMGVLAAIGFSSREIASQVRLKVLLAAGVGTLLGVVVAATVGEALVAAAISLTGVGVTRLHFIPNPWLVYFFYPLLLMGAAHACAIALTSRLRSADKSAWLRK